MSSRKSVLEPAAPPWSTALVLVCSECEGGYGVELAHNLKDSVKAAGQKKDIRVARVRCLGICPKRGVAVTVTSADRPACSYVASGREDEAVAALCDVILPK